LRNILFPLERIVLVIVIAPSLILHDFVPHFGSARFSAKKQRAGAPMAGSLGPLPDIDGSFG
jgi:hypothetical protein